jgi:hypothetical protein
MMTELDGSHLMARVHVSRAPYGAELEAITKHSTSLSLFS